MRLQALAEAVAAQTGFDPRGLSEHRLEALEKRLKAEGFDPGKPLDCPRLEELASAAVSVGETYFYRQAEHFQQLMSEAQSWTGRAEPVLAWSAGCATGEEPYSMAACLRFALAPAVALEVLGTDMSQRSLDLAAKAQYGKWSQRREGLGLPPVLKEGGAPEQMEVRPELKALTRFERHNLLEEPSLGGRKARIIFCRNVLIYLRPEAARQVIAHLAGALEEGGLLFLGSVDIDFAPQGLVPEEPRVLQIWRKPADRPKPAKAASPRPSLNSAPAVTKKGGEGSWAAEPEAVPVFDPLAEHLKALEAAENGKDASSLEALLMLRAKAPDYLPGLFDLAMALSRKGAKAEAAATLEFLLKEAQGRDLREEMKAPEPVSLGFYVTSAQTFLERYGWRS